MIKTLSFSILMAVVRMKSGSRLDPVMRLANLTLSKNSTPVTVDPIHSTNSKTNHPDKDLKRRNEDAIASVVPIAAATSPQTLTLRRSSTR